MGKVHEIGKISMCCKHGRAATIAIVWTAFFSAALPAAIYAQGEPASRPIIGEAEINANDVYVRSGDSLNHYTIIKLKAGDRVTVVGERGEWYEILPPEGSFSLVSGDYIDTTDDKTGIVNGANVRVRAGSLLNENKYTVQALLNKGAEVTILGRNPDGFLRIKPPPGATLWINKSFAQVTNDARPAGAASPDAVAPTVEPSNVASEVPIAEPGAAIAGPTAAKPNSKQTPSRTSTAASEAQHRKLSELDTALTKEFAKPVADRNFESFMAQYRTLIAEAGDEFIQQYAQRRLEELQTALEATSSIGHWKKIEEIAETKRREYRTARAGIPEAAPAGPSIEAKGELRISALFPPGGTPERYRLVDPSTAGERTTAYVEIPAGSNIRVNDFLNKFVGVRALERRVQSGGVNPIPIYIADDLVLLEPPDVQSNARPSP
jgi:uncharacterized protein YgiM (DUF1202 family)